MHRHGYRGKKFHRERDQRKALISGLAEALIIHETIETTLTKAKEVIPYVEKLITKAKKGDLHNRRQVLSSLQTVSSAHKLVDHIAPQLSSRNSGYFRIEKTGHRLGDNAPLARISFVDELKSKASSSATKPISNAAPSNARNQAKKPSAVKTKQVNKK